MKEYGYHGLRYYALSETNGFYDSPFAANRVYWRNPETPERLKDKRNPYIAYILSFYDKEGRKLPWVKVGKTNINQKRWECLAKTNRVPDSRFVVVEYVQAFSDEEIALAMENDFRYYFRQYKNGTKEGADYCKDVTFEPSDLKDPIFLQLVRLNIAKMFNPKYGFLFEK